MASLVFDTLIKKQIFYFCSAVLLCIMFVGCSSDQIGSGESKYTVQFKPYEKTLDVTQQNLLKDMVEHMSQEKKTSLVIDVPSPETQASSYERALWQARSAQLQQFLRMQGLSSSQIQVKECLSCSSILVG